jgi:hypothetical protein
MGAFADEASVSRGMANKVLFILLSKIKTIRPGLYIKSYAWHV